MFKKNKFIFLLVSLLISVLAITLNETGVFERLELMTFDLRLLAVNDESRYQDQESKVFLVAIRPEDTQELGEFPWNRAYYAQIIDRLREAGAKVICSDLFFISPRSPEEDRLLIDATRKAGSVIYPVFYGNNLTDDMFKNRRAFVPALNRNLPELASVAAGQGHINLKMDIDGKTRRFPSAISHEGELFPASALLSVLEYEGIPWQEVRYQDNYLRAGKYKIPLDKQGNILLKNLGRMGEIPWSRFADIKEKRVDKSFLKDKIIIIAYAISGNSYTDVYTTPRGQQFGMTIIASLIDNILRQDFLHYLPSAVNNFLLIITSMICILTMTAGSFRRNTLLFILFILMEAGAALYFFKTPGVILETIPLSTVILSNYIFGTIIISRRTDLVIREGKNRLKMFQEMAKTTTSSLGEKGSLDLIVPRIAQVLQAKLCILREFDKGTGTLKLAATYGLEEDIQNPGVFEFDLKLAEEAIASPEPLCLRKNDGSPVKDKATVMCRALKIKGEIIGTLSVHGKISPALREEVYFNRGDADLLATLAYETTIAVKNAQLYREVQKLFMDSVASLAATIDAKDRYTEHHSERVALYSLVIAEELSLTQSEKENLKLTATLHDIGKIGISESVLKKPGKLTDEEYDEMKLHPGKGAKIMEHIGKLQPIIPGMRHHHERYDGRGYPDGLTGESIPLAGRIIAVADTYDAMTSARPYRGACPPEVAYEEIKKNMGSQFDPRIAEAFLRAFSRGDVIASLKDHPKLQAAV